MILVGGQDSHSPVGDGDIDFEVVMKALHRTHVTLGSEKNSFEEVCRGMEALRQLQ